MLAAGFRGTFEGSTAAVHQMSSARPFKGDSKDEVRTRVPPRAARETLQRMNSEPSRDGEKGDREREKLVIARRREWLRREKKL